MSDPYAIAEVEAAQENDHEVRNVTVLKKDVTYRGGRTGCDIRAAQFDTIGSTLHRLAVSQWLHDDMRIMCVSNEKKLTG